MRGDTVLLITFEMFPYITGGIGSVSFQHARYYAESGYGLHIIGPYRDTVPFPVEGISYHGIPVRGNIRKTIKAVFVGIRVVWREKIGFVFAMTGTYSGIVAYLLKRIFKVNYFVMAHGDEFIRFQRHFFFRYLINKVYHDSTIIFSNSDYTKGRLMEFGAEGDNIKTIYCGVDTEKYYPVASDLAQRIRRKHGIPDGSFLLLTISRLDERKGHLSVVSSLDRIFKSNKVLKEKIFYLIGGRGENYHRILEAVVEKSLEENVRLIGYVSDEELKAYYSSADVFIMPNTYMPGKGSVEGFGIVFLEAAACKTCSIGGKVGGSSEAIVDNVTGFTVDGEDTHAIAERIMMLFNDSTLREKLSLNAFERAVREFSYMNIIKNEEGIIQSCLKG